MTDFNEHVASKACQHDSIPKAITVPGLLLCPVCDQGPLLLAETSVKKAPATSEDGTEGPDLQEPPD